MIVVESRLFIKDLRKIPNLAIRQRIKAGINRAIRDEDPSADVKPVAGKPGHHRLRIGGYRVLFKVEAAAGREAKITLEAALDRTATLERVVPRGELDQAVARLN